jgi:hypothetical protein
MVLILNLNSFLVPWLVLCIRLLPAQLLAFQKANLKICQYTHHYINYMWVVRPMKSEQKQELILSKAKGFLHSDLLKIFIKYRSEGK